MLVLATVPVHETSLANQHFHSTLLLLIIMTLQPMLYSAKNWWWKVWQVWWIASNLSKFYPLNFYLLMSKPMINSSKSCSSKFLVCFICQKFCGIKLLHHILYGNNYTYIGWAVVNTCQCIVSFHISCNAIYLTIVEEMG